MFLNLLFVFIAFIITSVFLTHLSFYLLNCYGMKKIDQMHRSAQFISEVSKVPPFWFSEAQRLNPRRASINRLSSLRRLKRLLHYYKHSTLVSDEETRYIIQKELTQVYNRWLSMNWNEMID
jgi:hypothetical protein